MFIRDLSHVSEPCLPHELLPAKSRPAAELIFPQGERAKNPPGISGMIYEDLTASTIGYLAYRCVRSILRYIQ